MIVLLGCATIISAPHAQGGQDNQADQGETPGPIFLRLLKFAGPAATPSRQSTSDLKSLLRARIEGRRWMIAIPFTAH